MKLYSPRNQHTSIQTVNKWEGGRDRRRGGKESEGKERGGKGRNPTPYMPLAVCSVVPVSPHSLLIT